MQVSRLAYRLAMFALAALGIGVAADAHVTDTINRYYFRTHHHGSTILIWLAVAVAVASVVEGITLVARRRLEKAAQPRAAADPGRAASSPVGARRGAGPAESRR